MLSEPACSFENVNTLMSPTGLLKSLNDTVPTSRAHIRQVCVKCSGSPLNGQMRTRKLKASDLQTCFPLESNMNKNETQTNHVSSDSKLTRGYSKWV